VQVQEGEGWRLALDPARQTFPVLVGGAGWAAELSLAEAQALRSGVLRLRDQHRSLEPLLMPEEQVSLELELELNPDPSPDLASARAGNLWLGLDGDRSRWALRFVLSPGGDRRGLEGEWAAAASAAISAALELLELAPV
jgi:hypothetical protein